MKKSHVFLITALLITLLSMSLVSAGLCKDSQGYYKDCDTFNTETRYKDYKFDPFDVNQKYHQPYDLEDRATTPVFKGSYGNYRYEMYANGDYRPYSYSGRGYSNYGYFGGGYGYGRYGYGSYYSYYPVYTYPYFYW